MFTLRNTLKALAIIAIALAHCSVSGQYVRLWRGESGAHVDLNIDRVWSYNLYEHWRWGAGARVEGEKWRTEGYVGYGMEDHMWKWGVEGEWRTENGERKTENGKRKTVSNSHIVRAIYDLEAAGKWGGVPSDWSTTERYATFMSGRMSHVERAEYEWRMDKGKWRMGVRARMSWEQRLWNSTGYVYPASYYHSGWKTLSRYTELTFSSKWKIVGIELTLGNTEDGAGCIPTSYARLLVDAGWKKDMGPFALMLQGHMGWCGGTDDGQLPYSRMFDLGGTNGAPVWFAGRLVTAYPSEFTANTFCMGNIHLQTAKPLWSVWSRLLQIGSYPRPFVELTAAWGALHGQKSNGELSHDGLKMQAPNMGIAEPKAGVIGLVRWGVVDWGIAAAYRLTPQTASYHRPDATDNLWIMLTAELYM